MNYLNEEYTTVIVYLSINNQLTLHYQIIILLLFQMMICVSIYIHICIFIK